MRAMNRTSGAGQVTFGALLPHAPILVPDVGRGNARAAEATMAAMVRVAARLVAGNPGGVIIISPHSPRKRGAFGIWSDEELQGSFAVFGASSACVKLPNDLSLKTELASQMQDVGLSVWDIPGGEPLDHGALVPLWYLARAGWSGPTLVLGLNYPGEGRLAELGSAISRAVSHLERRFAIVASGDMSHRLTPGAPAGYHPQAREFDHDFIAAVTSGEYRSLEQFDPQLREIAAEDAVDSTLVAAAATNWNASGHEVLSYDGPFGVGYGVAILCDADAGSDNMHAIETADCGSRLWTDALPQIARDAVKATLFESAEALPSNGQNSGGPANGVFVTIRRSNGDLRGCVGSILPLCDNIAEQTRQMACAAAFGDRRFPPVTREEFPELRFEVSVIQNLEEVNSLVELDANHYGVVVSTADGRTGCLLPGLPQIHNVQQQLDFARYKAGIDLNEPARMQRFETVKIEESAAARSGGVMFKNTIESDHEAEWWTALPDGRIECRLCPRECKLNEGQRGFCFVRKRLGDRIVLTTYGRSSGFCVDPVEKKPLNHFYPGSGVLSFGTAGCNLGCRFCQNWHISKAVTFDRMMQPAAPDKIAEAAAKLGCKAVAFTYNDPVIFAEYAIDVAQACHAAGVRTIAVTAGYINPEPRDRFFQHMDAANVDLKGFTDEFYRKLCFGRLTPVQETLEYLRRETNVWFEVTSLLIPGENDSDAELHQAADWFAEHLGPDVPWHFTAFHPDFKMLQTAPTPLPTLQKARAIALSKGIRYVYTGNVNHRAGSTTRCHHCGTELIVRDGYRIADWNLKAGACPNCGTSLAGKFESRPGSWAGRRVSVRLN